MLNTLYFFKAVVRKGTFKLAALLKIEDETQKKWDELNVFEENAPEFGTEEFQ